MWLIKPKLKHEKPFFTTIAANLAIWLANLLLASMCHAMPFSARALKKNISFDVDIVVKTNRNVVYRGLYSYRQRVRVITLFPNIFVRIVCAYMRVCKTFRKESLTCTSSSFAWCRTCTFKSDYERCFSLEHRTTNQQGNLWSLYQNVIFTWRRSRLSIRLNVH